MVLKVESSLEHVAHVWRISGLFIKENKYNLKLWILFSQEQGQTFHKSEAIDNKRKERDRQTNQTYGNQTYKKTNNRQDKQDYKEFRY